MSINVIGLGLVTLKSLKLNAILVNSNASILKEFTSQFACLNIELVSYLSKRKKEPAKARIR